MDNKRLWYVCFRLHIRWKANVKWWLLILRVCMWGEYVNEINRKDENYISCLCLFTCSYATTQTRKHAHTLRIYFIFVKIIAARTNLVNIIFGCGFCCFPRCRYVSFHAVHIVFCCLMLMHHHSQHFPLSIM